MNLGFIGTGKMGGGMAKNLLKAGHAVRVFDLDKEKVDELVALGGQAGSSVGDIIEKEDIVLTSLHDDVYVKLCEEEFLPKARKGQIFVDFGTIAAEDERQYARRFEEKGAILLDVPVSGGSDGAEAGTLRWFAGGDRAAFEKCQPVWDAIGSPEHSAYCGPAGSGQVVKAVNQMVLHYFNTFVMEMVAYGVRAGIEPEILLKTCGSEDDPKRAFFAKIAQRVIDGTADRMGIPARRFPQFCKEAQVKGFPAPFNEVMTAFCPDMTQWSSANRGENKRYSYWEDLMTHEGLAFPGLKRGSGK